ncbi:prepilin peptidase [Thermohalobacter berrensis]|uniref:Prepilin leader peptidase/N-methyltransferase n=1 Tax=Thermohalobacter berrensis TaxID=99594 RepID=A0A419TAV3_9FIRM|nr:A24 family peptidase [Thermohalobacter berrensis]RKD34591.1 peptidase A24 [Thermohalobacter berrensis]
MFYIITFTSLLIGSFLNVCIYRIPRGKSISYPPSHCPKCDTRLKPLDLIPVISYIFYRGKCRYCGEKISLQYPLIEILTAIIYILLFLKYGLTITFIKYATLSSLLLVISVIDYQHKIIPDKLNIFGLITGFIFISLYNFKIGLINGTIGLLIGGGLFLLIAVLTKGAMGGGDIKLMAVIGLWMGWKYIILISLLSFVFGAIISLLLLLFKIKDRKDYIPFGPFIALATFVTILYGSEIIQYYMIRY